MELKGVYKTRKILERIDSQKSEDLIEGRGAVIMIIDEKNKKRFI